MSQYTQTVSKEFDDFANVPAVVSPEETPGHGMRWQMFAVNVLPTRCVPEEGYADEGSQIRKYVSHRARLLWTWQAVRQ